MVLTYISLKVNDVEHLPVFIKATSLTADFHLGWGCKMWKLICLAFPKVSVKFSEVVVK